MSTDDAAVPLGVDIDGTLYGGDLLMEGMLQFVASRRTGIFALPFWLLAGRAAFKRKIAQAAPLATESLVFNPSVMAEVAAAKASGREVWLASAADELTVAAVAKEVGATGWFASDGRTNLAGQAKADALVGRFGRGGFDYIGNAKRDLPVWRQARHALGVGLSPRLARKVRALDETARMLPGPKRGFRDYVRALRPYQWMKNVLVFVPLIAAHQFEVAPYATVAGVFVALSVCASGAYLLNDLLDLPHDRQCAVRNRRPLAAGQVAPLQLIYMALGLMASGLALAFSLSNLLGGCVLFYLLLSLAYSLWLKRVLLIDVITLSVLYGMRVISGAAAVAVVPSPWLLAFFLFFFLSLAAVKRQGELSVLRTAGGSLLSGRAYRVEDLAGMTALAMASGSASIVVFALYIQSAAVGLRYGSPELLWLLCPVLVYWLGRMILIANRGEMEVDPVMFAMRDLASWLVLVISIAIFAGAL